MSIDLQKMDRALNPSTVAVVGDKQITGYMWLKNMSTFNGPVYSVQIDPNDIPGIEAMGIPNYSSLSEIPGDVDYVLVAVPRRVAPFVLKDAIDKGVGGVGMFTSGFAETGSDEGIELQERVTQMARDAGLVLLGPNCMGLFNAELGVRFSGKTRSPARAVRSSSCPRAAATAGRSRWRRSPAGSSSTRSSALATAWCSRTPTTWSTSGRTKPPASSPCTWRACETAAASSGC